MTTIPEKKLELGRLSLEGYKFETMKEPAVSIDWEEDGCYSCSRSYRSEDIDKQQAIEIISFLTEMFDLQR